MKCQHRSGCPKAALGMLTLAGVPFAYCYDHMRLIAPITATRLAGVKS